MARRRIHPDPSLSLEELQVRHERVMVEMRQVIVEARQIASDSHTAARYAHDLQRNITTNAISSTSDGNTGVAEFGPTPGAENAASSPTSPFPPVHRGNGGAGSLTRRETEVVKAIAEGHSTKEIAAMLGITFKTAACHRYRAMDKLGIHDTASLVRYAIRSGLVDF